MTGWAIVLLKLCTTINAWVQTTRPRSRYGVARKRTLTRWYVPDDDAASAQGTERSSAVAGGREEDLFNQHGFFGSKQQLLDLRILLVDNHDSYTYNIYQYLSTMTQHAVDVIVNDAYSSWDEFITSLHHDCPEDENGGSPINLQDHYDCVVLSPGPGSPTEPSDMGIVLDLIRRNSQVPILGVCLGHQALGYVYGCDVKLAPSGPVHGQLSAVTFEVEEENDECTCDLFKNLRRPFDVVRYHSLVVDTSECSCIEPLAWCKYQEDDDATAGPFQSSDENICMALRHKNYPHYGVQFHPESIGTGEAGYQLIWNFCEFAQSLRQRRNVHTTSYLRKGSDDQGKESPADADNDENDSRYRVLLHKIEADHILPLPEQLFDEFYSSCADSFWLDSSTGETAFGEDMVDETSCPISSNSRFSIMGANDGLLSRKIEYFGREHKPLDRGLRVRSAESKEVRLESEGILSYLRHEMEDGQELVQSIDEIVFEDSNGQTAVAAVADEPPFDYRGGYVGFLGYEVRHDTQCWSFQQEGGMSACEWESTGRSSDTKTNPNIPTAAFFFVDRSLVYDHKTGEWYLIGVSTNNSEESFDDTVSWMRETSTKIGNLRRLRALEESKEPHCLVDEIAFVPNRSKAQYQADIARSHEEIRNGESYELCVTNQLELKVDILPHPTKEVREMPFELYKLLRRRNAAPFSAFMSLHAADRSLPGSGRVSICCSSPERFLSINRASSSTGRRFVVESKPIKGTAARYVGSEPDAREIDQRIAQTLKLSVKDRAENLMIVDLLRNDLGRVCEVGTVHVPKLMNIETYATVHQMVSTVRGTINGDKTSAIDVIEACFPGGSMTGAPKQRTMDILDEIEQGVSRGPYSGCLGYISLNGCMDMNIVIRSAILTPVDGEMPNRWNVSIGCGGAITALSNSEDEYEEMLLKSRILRETIDEWRRLNFVEVDGIT